MEALKLLSELKIIHGDIKPENIMRRKNRSIMVIDLGLSLEEIHFGSGWGIQTKNYRAPEVYKRQTYCCQVDMWSVGCVIYEMITTYPLFPSLPKGEEETEERRESEKKEKLLCVSDRDLKDFLNKCLESDPKLRITPEAALSHPFLMTPEEKT